MKKKKKKLTKKELEKRELNKKDKEWKRIVKERDGCKCIVCGKTIGVCAHHIIPREIRETRHHIDNGICVCHKHHKFSRRISAHKSPFIFYSYLRRIKPEQLQRLLDYYNFISSNKDV